MTVSPKSTPDAVPEGAGACPFVGSLTAAGLAATGAVAGAGLVDSTFNALLEMTNLRRADGALILGALGELARLERDAGLGTVTLRFDINYQTKNFRAGSVKLAVDR